MKQKIPEIGAHARTQIANTLPLALEKAISSYHEFMDDPDRENSTDFKNHHAACRAALAHIELLMKLAGMVDDMDDKTHDNLAKILDSAKQELERGNNE